MSRLTGFTSSFLIEPALRKRTSLHATKSGRLMYTLSKARSVMLPMLSLSAVPSMSNARCATS